MSATNGAHWPPIVDRPQKVQVFSLGKPRSGTGRRHYVKWRVDGRDRTRSFKTRSEADRFRSSLVSAVRAGDLFDEATGEPVSWRDVVDEGPTWWEWSRDWVALK